MLENRNNTPLVHRRRGESGFTMVELMIAMVIALVGLLGLLTVQSALGKGNRVAGHSAEAVAIGQGTMEEVRAMGISEIEAGYSLIPFSDQPMTSLNGRAGQTYDRELSAWALDAELVMIRIVVRWTEGGAAATDGGPSIYDHSMAFEMIRARSERL